MLEEESSKKFAIQTLHYYSLLFVISYLIQLMKFCLNQKSKWSDCCLLESVAEHLQLELGWLLNAHVHDEPVTVIPTLMDGNYVHNRIYIETLEKSIEFDPFLCSLFLPFIVFAWFYVFLYLKRWSLIQFQKVSNSINIRV